MDIAGKSNSTAGAELEPRVTDGLYTLGIEMSGAKSGRATGVVVLQNGRIMGGDSFFYYTGSYSFSRGKWRGEMIVHQHAEAPASISSSGAARSRAALPEPIPKVLPTSTGRRWSAATASRFVRD